MYINYDSVSQLQGVNDQFPCHTLKKINSTQRLSKETKD